MDENLHIFLIAGEPSGDLLGARLMAALKERQPQVRFTGIGGPQMTREGLESLVPIEELALHGITEVIKHIPNIKRRINQTVEAVFSQQPSVLVTIDAPGFSLRVAQRVKGAGIPLVHYVAPTVWAWKPGRAKKVSGYLDHLLTLFDFEPPYFMRHGLGTTFVGHPLTESSAPPSREYARSRLGVAPDDLILALLPGSRKAEISRMLPFMGEVLARLKSQVPDVKIIIPAVDFVREDIERLTADWPDRPLLVDQDEGKALTLAAADCALACSGTITMELAWARVPTVVAYKVSWFTGIIGYAFLKVRFAAMMNVIADQMVQPEFIQRQCRVEAVEAALKPLLMDETARQEQIKSMEPFLARLRDDSQLPSRKAADIILSYAKP